MLRASPVTRKRQPLQPVNLVKPLREHPTRNPKSSQPRRHRRKALPHVLRRRRRLVHRNGLRLRTRKTRNVYGLKRTPRRQSTHPLLIQLRLQMSMNPGHRASFRLLPLHDPSLPIQHSHRLPNPCCHRVFPLPPQVFPPLPEFLLQADRRGWRRCLLGHHCSLPSLLIRCRPQLVRSSMMLKRDENQVFPAWRALAHFRTLTEPCRP